MTETIYKYQDVGRNYQKDLLGKWYKDLSTANEKKEPVGSYQRRSTLSYYRVFLTLSRRESVSSATRYE